jgi:hypothetical protein
MPCDQTVAELSKSTDRKRGIFEGIGDPPAAINRFAAAARGH